jgi:hypothetical protein
MLEHKNPPNQSYGSKINGFKFQGLDCKIIRARFEFVKTTEAAV